MLIDYRYKNGANQNLKISNNERHNDKKYCIKCNKFCMKHYFPLLFVVNVVVIMIKYFTNKNLLIYYKFLV